MGRVKSAVKEKRIAYTVYMNEYDFERLKMEYAKAVLDGFKGTQQAYVKDIIYKAVYGTTNGEGV